VTPFQARCSHLLIRLVNRAVLLAADFAPWHVKVAEIFWAVKWLVMPRVLVGRVACRMAREWDWHWGSCIVME
jgi:hypothetical protein